MSQWRSQSFGGPTNSTASVTGGVIPNAVKMFMNQQNKTVGSTVPDATISASTTTSLDFVSSNSKSGSNNGGTEASNPLAAFSSQQKNAAATPAKSEEILDKKSNIVAPKILLASAAPGSAIPLTGSLVEAIKASANTVSKKDSLNTAQPKNLVKALEKMPTVSADAIAAEEFMASLANPLFKQMPVDKSLAAALRSMNEGSVNAPSKKFEILAGLEKKKRKRRSILGAFVLKHMTRRSDSPSMNKPMERSSMETPALSSTQQGPQLLDKIRDMGRVVATP